MGDISDFFTRITRKTTYLKITESKSEIRGGNSWEFLVGCMVLQILTQFQTKKFSFSTLIFRPGKKPYPSSDLAQAEIMLPLLRFERQLKHFLKLCRIRILLFLFYSFELNRQIRSCVPVFPRKPLPNSDQTRSLRKTHILWSGTYL